MDQKFVDAITNVRMVSGTIRIDLMNITGQTDDNKLQFSKTGEIILSPNAFAQALKTMQDVDAELKKNSDHVVLKTSIKPCAMLTILKNHFQDVALVGYGKSIEIFKQVGDPSEVVKKFKLDDYSGSHAIGHTRMATESAITTDGSHPYSTGEDECLVHNGSLSNHNNLRRKLKKDGVNFGFRK